MLELPGVRVRHRPRRRRDDGEPLVRPLARLARRGRRVPRGRPAPLRARLLASTATSTRRSRARPGRSTTAHLVEHARPARARTGAAAIPIPGHGWNAGRAQRDGGFLAPGSGNDEFATGYYLGEDLPFTSAARAVVHDVRPLPLLRCSARRTRTASTSTRRSPAGTRPTHFPPDGRLPVGDDLGPPRRRRRPGALLLLGPPGPRALGRPTVPFLHPVDRLLHRLRGGDAAERVVPRPEVRRPGAERRPSARRHPAGSGVRPRRVPRRSRSRRTGTTACSSSPTTSGAASSTTSRRRTSPTTATSAVDADDFSQAGFRVPTIIASPFARPGFVDHRAYEHTSILRFLEWRFLGAPPEGPGRPSDSWFLTSRDRNANNLGAQPARPAVRGRHRVRPQPPDPAARAACALRRPARRARPASRRNRRTRACRWRSTRGSSSGWAPRSCPSRAVTSGVRR